MNRELELSENDQKNDLKREITQNLKVYDTQNHLLGDVQHIIRGEDDQLQIVFALPNQEKPLFRVSRQTVRKVDLENSYVTILLTKPMREELLKHDQNNTFKWIETDDHLEDSTHLSQPSLEEEEDHSILDEATIRLLEERLTVDRTSTKVGEVVVRKVVETKMVEVPVRQEKLVIEQVTGDQTENLAEIDLSSEVIQNVDQSANFVNSHHYNVQGEFMTPDAASEILKAISLQKDHGCRAVKIELLVSDDQKRKDYQAMFDRCTGHD